MILTAKKKPLLVSILIISLVSSEICLYHLEIIYSDFRYVNKNNMSVKGPKQYVSKN